MTASYFRPLAESTHYLLGHEWETAIAVRKDTGERTVVGEHYGDPAIGVITADEAWFVTGGEGVVCHHSSGSELSYFRVGHPPLASTGATQSVRHSGSGDSVPEHWSVHSLRLDSVSRVRVLIDPWSPHASVWEIELSTGVLTKIQDGPFLSKTPYVEYVPF